ncbi:hypothetical protein FKB34_15165 [Glycocaulis profundi]|nr:hypothetical protein FKB34_15165 [Glycocaulis profundi]
MRVWLNGGFVPEAEASVSAADRGFLLGDGAFETMRYQDGAIRRWPRHRARLADALDVMAIAAPDFDAIEAAAGELAAERGLDRAALRLTVSRGPHGRGLAGPSGQAGTVLLTAAPLPDAPRPSRLVGVGAPRRDPFSLSARFKTLGYADAIHARRQAVAMGGTMAVMLGHRGKVASTDCASLFLIEGQRIFTPHLASGALDSTSRAALIEAAGATGIIIDEIEIGPERLAAVQAAFTLNALTGVVGAESLDGRALRADHPLIARLSEIEASAA